MIVLQTISFPKLGFSFAINRKAISFGEVGIYWYGIIIAIGVILGYLYARSRAKRLGEKTENVTDLLLWALPFSVLGARTYYVLFSWKEYAAHPADIVKIWQGGIAIYGAVIASVIVAIVFTKHRHLSTLRYFDMGIMGVMLGQIIGRWGNFVNGEAYGGPTDLPWGMLLPGESHPVHPTFLYESLWNLLGFLLLHLWGKKKPKDGSIFCGYLIWYGIGRFFIEGLRTDSLYLWYPYIRISQVVSVVAVIFGIIFLLKLYRKEKNDPNVTI